MGYPLTPPSFPVVDPDPDAKTVMAYMRRSDLTNAAIITATGAPFGYFAGRPVLMRPSMWCGILLGATGGALFAMQSSFQRLTGHAENAAEVAAAAAAHDHHATE